MKAIKAATDLESDAPHLSGMSVITLEGYTSTKALLSFGLPNFLRELLCLISLKLDLSMCRTVLFSHLFFLPKWVSLS